MSNLLKELFLEHVNANADKEAIEASGQTLSYAAFYHTIQEVEALLKGLNISNKAILVLNDQHLLSYAGMLAINFSGNVFVPVDASWPHKRMLDIIAIVKPVGLLISSKNNEIQAFLNAVPEMNDLLILDAETKKHNQNINSIVEATSYDGMAYIIFTSGSTGTPKGVPVSIKNLNAFITNIKADYSFATTDRFLQVYDITFDVTYFSFFIPFCYGACCCILNHRSTVPKYLSIINDLVKRNITVVSMVPTIINLAKHYLKKQTATSVTFSFFIGDVLLHSDAIAWQQFVPNAEIHNHYGPTEATIACSKYTWNEYKASAEVHHDVVPIGKLFGGLSFKLVDETDKEVEANQVGELAISGDQVVQGYLGGVHSEKFFTSITESGQEAFYYKTGDLASINDKENLLFHGRIDHQVKLNGFRIELTEVQLALAKVTGKRSVVVKQKNTSNTHYLAAFIEGETMDAEQIKQALRLHLPAYMIPTTVTFLPELPLTENGKINVLYLQNL